MFFDLFDPSARANVPRSAPLPQLSRKKMLQHVLRTPRQATTVRTTVRSLSVKSTFNPDEPPFAKVMAANRGEIAVRIMRAATELQMRTVGIYSAEDRNTAHPSKADEAYLVGEGKAPVAAYLDIDSIVATAVKNNVQAVHPGYGFLSENPEFNQKLQDAGVAFVGPTPQNLIEFGDKTQARRLAKESKVPLVPGTEEAVRSVEEAKLFTNTYGFPIIIKAAHGGGGKGMRVVMNEQELKPMMDEAMGEALTSFGNGDVFLERYVLNPRHVEVQILGDGQGKSLQQIMFSHVIPN